MSSFIKPEEASENYGVRAYHELMPNKELRFRLQSSDGGSYVRTVATVATWQEAHYHEKARETYLVHSGWMALALLRGRRVVIKRYGPDSIITVECQVYHNIYLSAGTVIHVIKQGRALDENRYPSPKLQELTIAIPQSEINKVRLTSPRRRRSMKRQKCDVLQNGEYAKYSDDYRHFDNLIWQLPAWSTAVFAAILSALAYISSANLNGTVTFDPACSILALLTGALVFFAGGYYALFRWRVHQRYTNRERAPRPPLFRVFGGQVFLQFVTGAQATVMLLLLIAKTTLLEHGLWRIVAAASLLLATTVAAEWRLRRHPQRKYQDSR